MKRARVLAVMIALASAAPLVACGPPPAPPAAKVKEAAWADAIDGDESLVAVVRPKALARDPVYGPLMRASLATALAKEGATPSLDVLAAAEEIILILPGKKREGPLLILSGMDASKDPERAADEKGMPLFRRAAETKGVVEYTSTTGKDASLFALGHRTWVIASGDARPRARIAFANPMGRPTPTYGDDTALAIVRLDGPALLDGIPRSRGALANVTKSLANLTLSLLPDKKGIDVTLHYANDDQAGISAVSLDEIRKRIGSDPNGRFAYFAKANVARDGNRDVKVHVDIPPQMIEELRRVSPAELNF